MRGESDINLLFLEALHDKKKVRLICYSKDDNRKIIRVFGVDKTHITDLSKLDSIHECILCQKGEYV